MQNRISVLTRRRLATLVGSRRQVWSVLVLALLAPVLMIATYMVLGGVEQASNPVSQRLIIMADIVYVIVVAGLSAQRVAG